MALTKAWRAKVGDGGRVIIPAEVRQELGICIGEELRMQVIDGEIHLFTLAQGIRRAQEMVRERVPEGVSLVDQLIAERRAEAARE